MAKVVKLRPKPQTRPIRWDIYHAAAKARLIGTVEAPTADDAIKVARGLAGDLFAGLVRDGLASVASETLWTDGQPVEVIRVQITDSGPRRSTSPLPAVQPTISGRSDLRFAICAE